MGTLCRVCVQVSFLVYIETSKTEEDAITSL